MSNINLQSVNRLSDWIRDNIFNSYDRYRDYRFECKPNGLNPGYEYSEDEDEENNLICTFHVTAYDVEYELTGNMRKNPRTGDSYPEKDYNKYKITKTVKHDVSLIYPKDNLGLIETSEGKRKTTINSARYFACLRFTKYNYRMLASETEGRYAIIKVKFYEKGKSSTPDPVFEIALGPDIVINLASLLQKYNLWNIQTPWMKKMGMSGTYNKFITKEPTEINSDDLKSIKRFKINQKVLDKLEIFSKGSFKPTSDYLDANLLDFICSQYFVDFDKHAELGFNRYCDKYCMDTPFDFEFMDATDGVLYDLKSSTEEESQRGQTTLGHILSSLYLGYDRMVLIPGTNKKDHARTINENVIQHRINKYFRMQTENFHDVQTTKDSNTLTITSQNNTLYYYAKIDADGKRTDDWKKQRIYNKSFNGVVDPTRTRDSANINVTNEFSFGTRLNSNNQIEIEVMEIKTGLPKVLSYAEFCKEPILARECYDEYEKKPIVSPYTNKYEILQYTDYTGYDELPKEVKYTRSKLNELSVSTAMIPFPNRMVATRTLLSSHFLTQSIPVIGAKPTVVHTKMPKAFYKDNPENIVYKLDEEAEVVDIRDQLIKIETKSGKTKILGKGAQFNKTAMTTYNIYNPVVTIGQKIKKGDILEVSNSFVDGEFTTQVPLYTMFGTYKAREHEDGIILTESAAKKFAHLSEMEINEDRGIRKFYSFKRNNFEDETDLIVDKTKVRKTLVKSKRKIKKEDKPTTLTSSMIAEREKLDKKSRKYNLDEWSFIKEGSFVTAGSLLFEYYKYNNEDIYSGLYEKFGSMGLKPVIEQIRVPYNVRGEGTVKSAHIYINDADELFDEGSPINYDPEKEVPGYKMIKELEKDFRYPGTFGLDLKDNIEAFKYFKAKETSYAKDMLKWKEETISKGKSLWSISDPENSFEIRIVVEYSDELTPERLGAKLSNFYASKGVNVYLIPDKFAPYDKFGNIIECIISSGTTFSRQNTGQIDDLKLGLIGLELAKKILKVGKTPKVEKLLNKIYPRGYSWKQLLHDAKTYGYCRIEMDYFETYYTHERILDIIKGLGLPDDGDSEIYLPEYETWTTEKATVGVTALMRLHFIQEHKAGITPDSKHTATDSNCLTYRDLEKPGGQKMGQMEIQGLASHGEMEIIKEVAKQKDKSSKRAVYDAALIQLGFGLNKI